MSGSSAISILGASKREASASHAGPSRTPAKAGLPPKPAASPSVVAQTGIFGGLLSGGSEPVSIALPPKPSPGKIGDKSALAATPVERWSPDKSLKPLAPAAQVSKPPRIGFPEDESSAPEGSRSGARAKSKSPSGSRSKSRGPVQETRSQPHRPPREGNPWTPPSPPRKDERELSGSQRSQGSHGGHGSASQGGHRRNTGNESQSRRREDENGSNYRDGDRNHSVNQPLIYDDRDGGRNMEPVTTRTWDLPGARGWSPNSRYVNGGPSSRPRRYSPEPLQARYEFDPRQVSSYRPERTRSPSPSRHSRGWGNDYEHRDYGGDDRNRGDRRGDDRRHDDRSNGDRRERGHRDRDVRARDDRDDRNRDHRRRKSPSPSRSRRSDERDSGSHRHHSDQTERRLSTGQAVKTDSWRKTDHAPTSQSSRPREKSPRRDHEDGEVSDTPPPQKRPRTPRPLTPPPPKETAPTPPHDAKATSRPKIVRPTKSRLPSASRDVQPEQPPPPPPDGFRPPSPADRPPTPPFPPPPGSPPPPPPPSNPNPYAFPSISLPKPVDSMRNGSALHPSAPGSNNRQNQNTTRHSSPLPHSREKNRFTIWPEAKEKSRLGRIFEGTTTLEDYDLGTKLGEGTFGVVTKATEKVGGAVVALKKLITHNPRDGVSVTTVREIRILKALEHENVVPIRAMVVHRKHPNNRSDRGEVFMVFPYMDHDLCGLLANKNFAMSVTIAKTLLRQLLEGLVYIHGQNIIHRDIKTANILVDRKGQVMIADFGLARGWTPKGAMPPHMENEYTNMVVTRWYRAPELLLGSTKYGPEIDLWSTGCVFGEMFSRNPILCGESDRDQLYKIVTRCGPLDEESFPGWADLPGFPDSKGHPWDQLPLDKPLLDQLCSDHQMSRQSLDLLGGLLRLDPVKRFTAVEALEHIWFWSAPMPERPKDGLITVESSHEFTTRRPEKPAPIPVVQHRPGRNQAQQNFSARGQGQGYNARPAMGMQQQPQPMGMQGGMGMGQGGMAYGQNGLEMGYHGQQHPTQQPYQQQHQHQSQQPSSSFANPNPYLQQIQPPPAPHQQQYPNSNQPPNGHGHYNASLVEIPYPPYPPPPIPTSFAQPTHKPNVPAAPFALAGNAAARGGPPPPGTHALPPRPPGVAPPPFKLAPTQAGQVNGAGGMRPGEKRPPAGPAADMRDGKRARTDQGGLHY